MENETLYIVCWRQIRMFLSGYYTQHVQYSLKEIRKYYRQESSRTFVQPIKFGRKKYFSDSRESLTLWSESFSSLCISDCMNGFSRLHQQQKQNIDGVNIDVGDESRTVGVKDCTYDFRYISNI